MLPSVHTASMAECSQQGTCGACMPAAVEEHEMGTLHQICTKRMAFLVLYPLCMQASYCEIYNEQIFDLLAGGGQGGRQPGASKLEIREKPDGDVSALCDACLKTPLAQNSCPNGPVAKTCGRSALVEATACIAHAHVKAAMTYSLHSSSAAGFLGVSLYPCRSTLTAPSKCRWPPGRRWLV